MQIDLKIYARLRQRSTLAYWNVDPVALMEVVCKTRYCDMGSDHYEAKRNRNICKDSRKRSLVAGLGSGMIYAFVKSVVLTSRIGFVLSIRLVSCEHGHSNRGKGRYE